MAASGRNSRFGKKEVNHEMKKMDRICFRGDTRDPDIIFEEGFHRIGGTFNYYFAHGNKIQEPTFRFFHVHHGEVMQTQDIDPSSAVCASMNFDFANIFPHVHPAHEKPFFPITWIYVVNIQHAYNAYEEEKKLGDESRFVKELASRDIPSGDVICAIQSQRFFYLDKNADLNFISGMHYRLMGNILWNPKLKNEIATERKIQRNEAIINLIRLRQNKYVVCPIPQNHRELILNDLNQIPLTFISEEEHRNRIHLMNFAIALKGMYLSSGSQQYQWFLKAIEEIKLCNNLNTHIPGMNISPLDLAQEQGLAAIVAYLQRMGAAQEEKVKSEISYKK